MKNWYFPSNRNVFDMVRCLQERDAIDQPFYSPVIKSSAKVGDIVYIYVTEPYGQFLYKMEVIAVFDSFADVNQGRWAKYIGNNIAPAKGRWVRLKNIDNANPGFKPLQPTILRQNNISTSAAIYPLSKEKAEYLDAQFAASKVSQRHA